MPFASGRSACPTCATVLTDVEVYDGLIYSCPACSPTAYFHATCVAPDGTDLHCPVCAVALVQEYVDAWGAEESAREDTRDRLYSFLSDPPRAEEWVYLGYQHGGHEVSWRGGSPAVFGLGDVEVHFHVHFTGRYYDGNPDWRYGGAWARGETRNGELSVDEARELHGTLLPVVQQHWTAMLDTEQAIDAGSVSTESRRRV